MRIGGPYSVKISFVGYKEQTIDGIYLSPGTAADVNVKLVEESAELRKLLFRLTATTFSVPIAQVRHQN